MRRVELGAPVGHLANEAFIRDNGVRKRKFLNSESDW
jgi:hypothetical protein